MKKRRFLITALALINITGCMSTMDKLAGVGQINSSTSEFSGARVVELSQSHNYSVDGMVTTKFGARWTSDAPESVALKLIYNSDSSQTDSYTSFSKIKVNMNGDIKTFSAGKTYLDRSDYNDVSRTIYTTSVAYVTLPLSYLEEMLNADSCKIRISSNDGYEDVSFDVGKLGAVEYSKAKLANFVEEIKK